MASPRRKHVALRGTPTPAKEHRRIVNSAARIPCIVFSIIRAAQSPGVVDALPALFPDSAHFRT
jgi:hypothetical protein